MNKSTWQQHPLSNSTRDVGSEKAVDGLFTDRGSGGQCTLSDGGHYTAEWRVDLGSVVSISRINIYYRTDNQGRSIFITFFHKSCHCLLRSKVNLKIKLFVFTILRYGIVLYSVHFFIFVNSRHTVFLIILLVRISNLYITLSWLFTFIMLKSLANRYYFINRMFRFVNIFYTSGFLKVFRYDHNLYQIICCQSFKCGPFHFRCF